MLKRLAVATVLATLATGASAAPDSEESASSAPETCIATGMWRTAADPTPLPDDRLVRDMAARPVVLLGEAHDNAEHHRWQLQMVAALHALKPNMVLAFEMFPRRVQPVLDAWLRGDMDSKTFLRKVDWEKVWRYDANHYLPLFHFARMNRIPMVAMNVEQSLVGSVRKNGWDGVPEAEREGVGKPAPAGDAYRKNLFEIYGSHFGAVHGEGADEAPPSARDSQDFDRFVQAQATWDRAMAEAIAKVRKGGGDPLVVGIAGAGHLRYRWGIPHQLADLGIPDAAVLLPWDKGRPCADLVSDSGTAIADAIFGLSEPPAPPAAKRQLLGVRIKADDGGVTVEHVLDDSVAAAAGIKEGDRIVTAAGIDVTTVPDLIAIIHRQGPGTWLPMEIERDGARQSIVAKFAPAPLDP